MKRFKTKQELNETWPESWDVKGTGGQVQMKEQSLWGLPYKDEYCIHDNFRTTDPHPFDSMDIKVRVTPKQSKKLQKKAFKIGYKWPETPSKEYWDISGDYICLEGETKYITYIDIATPLRFNQFTELTYKQFMNGTVPKKKDKFEVGEYYKGDTGLIIKCTGKGDAEYPSFAGVVVEVGSGYYAMGFESTTWGSDAFKHTTKPKEQPIKADDIIKPEVIERLKEVTILSIKACKSIKEVEEAYSSLQNTIKEL